MSNELTRTTKLAIWIARVFPLPFILIGATFLYSGGKELYLATESETWPSVDGTILSSTVKHNPGCENNCIYKADILYQYMVDGQTRRGNKIAFGETNPNYAEAQIVANQYPTGMPVKVYYRIKDPNTCTLKVGMAHGHFWTRVGFGLFLVLFFSLFGIFYPRLIRQKEEQKLLTMCPATEK